MPVEPTPETLRAYAAECMTHVGERIPAMLDAAADRIEELEDKVAVLSCELIEARNPGIEYDPKWPATKAKRLGVPVGEVSE